MTAALKKKIATLEEENAKKDTELAQWRAGSTGGGGVHAARALGC